MQSWSGPTLGAVKVVLVGALGIGPGCGRSEVVADIEESSTTGEPSSTTQGPSSGETTAGDSGVSSGGDSGEDTGSSDPADSGTVVDLGVPQLSCRDILDCALECLLVFDLECISACGSDLDPAEGQAAIALVGCAVGVCLSEGSCSPADLQEPACLACLGLSLLSPVSPGCEAEAAACQ